MPTSGVEPFGVLPERVCTLPVWGHTLPEEPGWGFAHRHILEGGYIPAEKSVVGAEKLDPKQDSGEPSVGPAAAELEHLAEPPDTEGHTPGFPEGPGHVAYRIVAVAVAAGDTPSGQLAQECIQVAGPVGLSAVVHIAAVAMGPLGLDSRSGTCKNL